MLRLLLALLVFGGLAFAEDDDPSIFHHVNVITGNLNVAFQDGVVQGAQPIVISRTYSSSGALERTPQNFDRILQGLRKGWLVQGGWSFFPTRTCS
ncbi:MAG: hypothetical protein RL235_645 [Chlamydiota bacterium]|jgi:hypothetical protein